MKEILLTEKEMVFLVLLYFHGLIGKHLFTLLKLYALHLLHLLQIAIPLHVEYLLLNVMN